MADHDYDIVNLALVRLGANTITSLSDGSRNANAANVLYEPLRDEVLKAHPWSFATGRAYLDQVTANVLTISGITQADPGVVTYTGTDPEDGDSYTIESVNGMTELNDNTYVVANLNASAKTFELMDTDTSDYGAYTSGGTATKVTPESSYWSYIYERPADCLRVIEIEDNHTAKWELSEHGFMCNEENVAIVYIRKVTDVTLFSPDFVSAFAARLAGELAIAITGKRNLSEYWLKLYAALLPQAQGHDAAEQRTPRRPSNKYVDARR